MASAKMPRSTRLVSTEERLSGKSAVTEDSGNDSFSSNSHLDDCTEDLQNCCERFHSLLSEKEQSLFDSLQDVRKLRSELERLSKSEQWYRQKVAKQKSTHLEVVERLYLQERKYMQENQRLQCECIRLYAKCTEMEQALEAQKDQALREVEGVREQRQVKGIGEQDTSQFELEKRQVLIMNQQELIGMLKRQRRELLEDLQRLNEEKETKLLELQRTVARLELENKRMNSKCEQLIDERSDLSERLESNVATLRLEQDGKQQLQQKMEYLQRELNAQVELLAVREHEISDLKVEFEASLKAECNMDEAHHLCMAYHHEVNGKTQEIYALKTTLLKLQEEHAELSKLKVRNTQLEGQLEKQQSSNNYERTQLQFTAKSKANEIDELQQQLASSQDQRAATAAQLSDAKTTLKSAEQELLLLHGNYANICALYEQTKFELQMREIEQKKLKFQTTIDGKDIDSLRGKLTAYLHKTTELSSRIAKLEALVARFNQQELQLSEQQTQTTESFAESSARLFPPVVQNAHVFQMTIQKQQKTQEVQTEAGWGPMYKADVEARSRRIEWLQKLVDQQNQKVSQLIAVQAEWEQLLQVLNDAQQLESQNHLELAEKRNELEELNTLFAEQNTKLQQLQAYSSYICRKQKDEINSQQQTFQQQLNELKEQLLQGESESKLLGKTISELRLQNKELHRRLQDDVQEHMLRTKLRGSIKEDLHYADRTSVDESVMSDSCESGLDSSSTLTLNLEQRMLTKIMESKRYALHIRTLLANVKGLKKALTRTEQKTFMLHSEQAKMNVTLRLTKMHLEEMRLKYEQSKAANKCLAEQLEFERKRYDDTDLGKSSHPSNKHVGNTHEVSNLMDDYKKLIKQSAESTQRLHTHSILELIQRSNQCVPNLNKIETSLTDLRQDMQPFLSGQHQPMLFAGFYSTFKAAPSLLDELRVAEQF